MVNQPDNPTETRKGRCLLSGASGYVGSRIKQRLIEEGWQVVELSRHTRSGAESIGFRLGDPIAPEALKGCSALVHCAYDFSQIGWADIHAINVRGSELLLRSAREAGVEHIAFISTISAFDSCKSLYGKGKLEVEEIAHSLGAWVIRPGLVYSENSGGMFGRLTAQVKRSKFLPMPGSGSQLMFMVHEDDLSKAVVNSLQRERGPSGTPITVAHDQPWPFRAILQSIGASLDRNVVLIPVPWRFMWMGLRMTEALGIPLGLRSDSLVSLVHQNPTPLLNADILGVECRPFEPAKIASALV